MKEKKPLKEVTYTMNTIIMKISERDTLRPLGIYFMLFANSVCDTIYHK